MYPVQLAAVHGVIYKPETLSVQIGQYTGGGYLSAYRSSSYVCIKKQMQDLVRPASYRYQIGQYRHILSYLACRSVVSLPSYVTSWMRYAVRNDRSMVVFV